MTDDAREWFVYDMDGVITTKNCLILYLRHRLMAHPIRALRALPARARLLHTSDADARFRLVAALVEAALQGMTLPTYHRSAERFGRHLVRRPALVRQDTVARIRGQHRAGAALVIATACEYTLAQAVLTAADIPYDILSATTFTSSGKGIRVADARYAERKRAALEELGVPLERAHFHTDAMSDHHTARRSARVTLIGASRWTLSRFRNAGIGAAFHRDVN